MTPFEMQIILHYYVCPDDFERLHSNAPRVLETFRELVKNGLLEETQVGIPKYTATDKLNAYVEHLMTIPLPIKRWVQPADTLCP